MRHPGPGLSALLAFLLVSTSVAAMTSREGELALVGKAQLKVLLWPIYESRLYSPTGRYSPEQRPLRLEIQYLRNIRASELVARTQLEWESLGKMSPLHQGWLAELDGLWPDIRRNDTLVIEIDEQDRSAFFFNGEPLGAIEDTGFGQDFLDIWLSPDTSRPAIRAALTGASGTIR